MAVINVVYYKRGEALSTHVYSILFNQSYCLLTQYQFGECSRSNAIAYIQAAAIRVLHVGNEASCIASFSEMISQIPISEGRYSQKR